MEQPKHEIKYEPGVKTLLEKSDPELLKILKKDLMSSPFVEGLVGAEKVFWDDTHEEILSLTFRKYHTLEHVNPKITLDDFVTKLFKTFQRGTDKLNVFFDEESIKLIKHKNITPIPIKVEEECLVWKLYKTLDADAPPETYIINDFLAFKGATICNKRVWGYSVADIDVSRENHSFENYWNKKISKLQVEIVNFYLDVHIGKGDALILKNKIKSTLLKVNLRRELTKVLSRPEKCYILGCFDTFVDFMKFTKKILIKKPTELFDINAPYIKIDPQFMFKTVDLSYNKYEIPDIVNLDLWDMSTQKYGPNKILVFAEDSKLQPRKPSHCKCVRAKKITLKDYMALEITRKPLKRIGIIANTKKSYSDLSNFFGDVNGVTVYYIAKNKLSLEMHMLRLIYLQPNILKREEVIRNYVLSLSNYAFTARYNDVVVCNKELKLVEPAQEDPSQDILRWMTKRINDNLDEIRKGNVKGNVKDATYKICIIFDLIVQLLTFQLIIRLDSNIFLVRYRHQVEGLPFGPMFGINQQLTWPCGHTDRNFQL